MPSPTKPSRSGRKRSVSRSRASTTVRPKSQVLINVYDLLPPGRLSTVLWALGSSLLHSGVVVNSREYAFGGHAQPSTTGVYFTRPRFEPPGGTFRLEILQGFTFYTEEEVEEVVKEVSAKFLGTDYNLLTYNCNHFTSALVTALTNRPAPAWLNRAATIGLALPCMVPKEWISPPDHETADGELLDDEDEGDERASMLNAQWRKRSLEAERERALRERGSKLLTGNGSLDGEIEEEVDLDEEEGSSLAGGRKIRNEPSSPPPRLVKVKSRDGAGRELPAAERAPVPAVRRT